MKKFLKIIGVILWAISGLMLSFAMVLNYQGGFNGNKNAFTYLVWMFAICVVVYTPFYLQSIFSNIAYENEEEIKKLRMVLRKNIRKTADTQIEYHNRLIDFGDKIRLLNIDNIVKSKEDKVKEVDDLFNNVPLDYPTQLLREKVLTYIRENG